MFVLLGNLVRCIINYNQKWRNINQALLFKMAAVGIRKSLPLFRHPGVASQVNRYLKIRAVKISKCLWVFSGYWFGDPVWNWEFFHRSFGLCCCRFSPGFDAILRNKIYSSRETKITNVSRQPRRTLIGSFLPNPLSASRRKKYSERRLLGWVQLYTPLLIVHFSRPSCNIYL